MRADHVCGLGRIRRAVVASVVAVLGGAGLSALQASTAQAGLAVSCPTNSDSYSSAVLADSPIAYYRLDEASGTTMCDSSSSANNGTYSSTGLTHGVAGALASSSDTAVAADGTPSQVGQSASDPTGLTGNHTFTLESWFKNAEASPYTNTTTASSPITMTVSDPSIQPGDVIYMVGPDGTLVQVGTATANGTVSITFTQDPAFLVAAPAAGTPGPVSGPPPSPNLAPGYRMVGRDGAVYSFGDAAFKGSAEPLHVAAPII